MGKPSKLFSWLHLLWRRIGDAHTLAWISPTLWGKALVVLTGAVAAAYQIWQQSPPWQIALFAIGAAVVCMLVLHLGAALIRGLETKADAANGTPTIDNRGGNYAGRDNTGQQHVYHAPVTIVHHAPSPQSPPPEPLGVPLKPIVEETIADAPIAPISPPTPLRPPKPVEPPRIFVEAHVTPRFLAKLYDEHTLLRAEKLIAEQVGKWMSLSGPLGEVYPGILFHDGQRTTSMVTFADISKPYLSPTTESTRVSAAAGVIHAAYSSAVRVLHAIPTPVGPPEKGAGETRRSAALVGWPSYPLSRI